MVWNTKEDDTGLNQRAFLAAQSLAYLTKPLSHSVYNVFVCPTFAPPKSEPANERGIGNSYDLDSF